MDITDHIQIVWRMRIEGKEKDYRRYYIDAANIDEALEIANEKLKSVRKEIDDTFRITDICRVDTQVILKRKDS